jgi:hypothetical protein
VCLLGLAGSCWASPAPRLLKLQTGEFDPLLAPPRRSGPTPGARHHLVQLHRPADAATLQRLRARLGPILLFVPEDTYLLRLDQAGAALASSLPEVRWVGPFLPEYKLSPTIGRRRFLDPTRRRSGRLLIFLFVLPGERLLDAVSAVERAGAQVLRVRDDGLSRRLLARVPAGSLQALARVEGISWIEEVGESRPRNSDTSWVIQSNAQGQTPIWDRGLHGESQILGHIDYPLDLSHCVFSDTRPPGPDHAKVVGFRVSTSQPDSHGTHTAATAAGRFVPGLGFPGIAHAARISHTDLHLVTGFGASSSNLDELLLAAHADGARVHSNSWGDDGTTAYTSLAQDIDRFSREYEEDLVVFAATNLATLRTPENAKNVLAVGASGKAPAQDTHCSGGAGPTADGRRKPEIYAPGCNIVSASAGTECGVTQKTGTSMACAAVAGAGLLVRQYYTEGFHPGGKPSAGDALTPSGALLRATLINAALDLSGEAGYPSDREGWGRLLLDQALHLDGEVRRLLIRDVRNAAGLSTGETDGLCFEVVDEGEPLRVTLAFTDVPAALNASDAVVNDLDLEVLGPEGMYAGNDFADGRSRPGGSADPRNTVEQVFLPSPALGGYTANVRAAAVRMERQGYALVLTGALREKAPLAAPEGLAAAAAGDGQISLQWTQVAGAAEYRVLRSYGGCTQEPQLVARTQSPQFLDSSVSGGVDVAYRVEAVAAGCSRPGASSACVTARASGPCTLAPAFEGLASAQDLRLASCSVRLTWSPARAYCGQTPRYSVYRSTDPDFVPGPANRIVPCQYSTSYTDLYGLDGGLPHHYLVRSEDTSVAGSGACGGLEDSNLRRLEAVAFGPGTKVEAVTESFEAGPNGWSSETPALWHLTESNPCVAPGFSSATHAWYFGQDASCDFDLGTTVQGTLISPPFGPLTASAELSFAQYREVESFSGAGDLDVTSVAVQGQNGSELEVWRQTSADPSRAEWEAVGPIPLPGFDGEMVRLRFRFDSGDAQGNRFAGWAIDDVRIGGVLGRESCSRAELPPPELSGFLRSGQAEVGVRFVFPRGTSATVWSGIEWLGSGVSEDLGYATVMLNRPLRAGDAVHAEALGRVGPTSRVYDPAELGKGSAPPLVALALMAAEACRRRRRRAVAANSNARSEDQ